MDYQQPGGQQPTTISFGGQAAYPQQQFPGYPQLPNNPTSQPSAAQPVWANTAFDSPLAQTGLHLGQQMITNYLKPSKLESIWSLFFSTGKYYFDVDTSYVINKLKILLFPFRQKSWKRLTAVRGAEGEVYLPPRDDINAPDLYIPTMAFVTYVLTVAFIMGTQYQFSPEVLGMTASSGLAALLLELAILKTGFYVLSAFPVSLWDIVAYCGYKFVGIVVTMLAGLLFDKYAYYGVLVYTSIAVGFFLVKTLRLLIPEVTIETGHKRNYFLVFVAATQILMSYILGVSA
jgi:hypothetical protein